MVVVGIGWRGCECDGKMMGDERVGWRGGGKVGVWCFGVLVFGGMWMKVKWLWGVGVGGVM